MPIIPALWRWGGYQKFKVILNYIVNLRLAWVTKRPCFKKIKPTNQIKSCT